MRIDYLIGVIIAHYIFKKLYCREREKNGGRRMKVNGRRRRIKVNGRKKGMNFNVREESQLEEVKGNRVKLNEMKRMVALTTSRSFLVVSFHSKVG